MSGGAGRNIFARMKAKPATHHAQAVVDRLRRGLWILIELIADIVDDRGFGNLCKRQALWFEPAGEVEQVLGVDTERTQRELAKALRV